MKRALATDGIPEGPAKARAQRRVQSLIGLVFAACGVFHAGAQPVTSYPSLVLAQSPVDYWRFNETKSSPAANIITNLGSAGAAGNGYAAGGALTGQAGGIVGSAVQFTNAGDALGYCYTRIDIPELPALNPSPPFAIEFWAKPTSLSSDSTGVCVLSANSPFPGGSARSGYLFYEKQGTGGWSFRLGGTNGYTAIVTSSGAAVSNAWAHIVGEFDGTNATLYVNGILSGSAAASPSAPFVPNHWVPTRIGGTYLAGGEYTDGNGSTDTGSGNRGYDGYVDEFAIYSNLLSSNTIHTHYTTGISGTNGYDALVQASHPVGYWNMDQAAYAPPNPSTYTSAADSGALGHTGTNTVGTLADQAGVPGLGASSHSVYYNGAVGSLVLNTNISGPNVAGHAITLAAWIKPNSFGYVSDIIAQGYDETSYAENFLRVGDAYDWENFSPNAPGGDLNSTIVPDVVFYEIGTYSGLAQGYVSAAFPAPASDIGQWVFLAGTYDGVNWNLYRNGTLVGQFADGGVGPSGLTEPWAVGSRSNPNPYFGFYFDGSISEASIFTNALSASEIMALYSAATGPVITWTNTAGGNWSAAANWSPNLVPGPSNTAVMPALVSNYFVTLDVAGSVSNLVVGATNGASTQTFDTFSQTLTVNGLIQVNSQGTLLVGGTLAGTNVLEGTLNCTGGTLSGVMTVSNNGTLVISNGYLVDIPLTLTNKGTVIWTNTPLVCSGGVTQIYNYGSWEAELNDYFIGTAFFNNYGIFRKSESSDTTLLASVVFNNYGTVDIESGAVQSSTNFNLTGGTINFGISSLTNYGAIILQGSVALTGTISATLSSNYVPQVNNSFQVLKFTSSSGTFTNTNLPPVAVWRTGYNSTNVTLTVLKLVPQLTWANPANIVYGTVLSGAQLNATAASPTNLSGSLAGTFVYTPPLGTALPAGNNQTLSVTFKPTDQVNNTNVTTSVAINVLQAPLTITATNQTKTYGQPVSFAGTEFKTSGLEFSDSVMSVTLTSGGAASPASVAGSPYTITNTGAVGNGLANYSIAYVNGTLTVNPAPLTITASPQIKTYGQLVTFGSGGTQFAPSGLQNGETIGSVTLAVTGNGGDQTAPVSGSPYAITPSAATGGTFTPGNYMITYSPANLTINPALVTVTASPQTTTYGQAATFGSGSTLFTSTPLQNGEMIGSVTLAIAGNGGTPTSPVSGSPYTIAPSAATGGTFAAGNYIIAYDPGILTVNPATLTVTASPENKTYGQTLLFGSASTRFTSSPLQNGETIGTVTLTDSGNGGAATAPVSGSPYAITPSAATGGTFTVGNYMITYVAGPLTVGQATPMITWPYPTPIIYGTPLTSDQLNATANVSGSFAYNPPDDTVLDTGTNALSATFTPSDQVDYTNATGMVSLIVTPASLTVTGATEARAYDQANPPLTGTITGVTNGDDVTASYSTPATISSPVGVYDITPTLVDPGDRQTNYTVTLNNGSLTIYPFASGVVFTLEPVGITNLPIGSNAYFSAYGTSLQFPTTALQYQWRLNGVNIPGATNTDLTILDVQPTNCGTITVAISDGISAATSIPVGLSVTIPTMASGNTDFADRFPLGSASYGVVGGSNTNGAEEPGEPIIISGNPGGKPVWFSWQPDTSGTAQFTTRGSDFDTIMGVYTGTSVTTLVREPSCVNDDDSGGYLTSKVLFNCVAGTEYEIVVDGYWGVTGNIVLSWEIESYPEPLPSLLQAPPRQTVSSNGAADTLVCQPDSGVPFWLFNGQPTGVTGNDFLISAVSETNVGTYVAETTIGGGLASTQPAHVQINLLEDGTSDPASMAWNKFLDAVNAPYSNPPQSSIRKLGDGGDTRGFSVAQTFSTVGNQLEPGEPSIDGQIGGSPAWYTYVTPTNGAMLINTAGSRFNTMLGVFSGSGAGFATLTNIGAGYTTNRSLNGQPQVYISNEPKGQTNFIIVDGYRGASGTVHLNINVGDPVVIGTAPQSQIVIAGDSATFTVGASGSTPISYLWQFNGANIAGETNSTLTIFDAADANAGLYSVNVSNLVSVVTNFATLSLGTTPVIVTQPLSQTFAAGTSAILTVTASGIPAPDYQWMFDGNDIGTNGPALVIPDFEAGNQGTYLVVASNVVGTAASSNALLYLSTFQLSAPSFSGNVFQVQLTGIAGGNYALQSSTDLVIWLPMITNTTTNGFLFLTDPNAGNFGQQFYRGVTN